MTMRKHLMISLAAAAAITAGAGVQAANIDAGRAKAKEVCAACHGENGNSTVPDYPRLAGQHADYLAKALRDYKSGARKNAIMSAFALALSKDDIDNLAEYFHAQPAAVSTRN
jgi:cytochrome c553